MSAFTFQYILQTLPPSHDVEAIELVDADGTALRRLENRPGSSGSLRVYHSLLRQYGRIDPDAARAGLKLYAEHTEDARLNPGKHPNVDTLLAIAEQGAPALQGRILPRA
jgi:hypothetical protein